MSGPEFHETRTGHRFLNHTMPRLVEELERLNEVLERLVEERSLGRQGESRDGLHDSGSGDPE